MFQTIFTYNDNEAFIIGHYKRLDNAGAVVAYHGNCFQSFAPSTTSNKLAKHSNVGVKGKYVWKVDDPADCAKSKFSVVWNVLGMLNPFINISLFI